MYFYIMNGGNSMILSPHAVAVCCNMHQHPEMSTKFLAQHGFHRQSSQFVGIDVFFHIVQVYSRSCISSSRFVGFVVLGPQAERTQEWQNCLNHLKSPYSKRTIVLDKKTDKACGLIRLVSQV
jgi:hypothetical protein